MGLDPIRYKPWNGQRTEHAKRFLVITDHVFRQKLRSKWLLGIIILGSILVWVFPIIIFSLQGPSFTKRGAIGVSFFLKNSFQKFSRGVSVAR